MMRTAFQRMQDDLDPLLRAAQEAGGAGGAPPRRYSDAERERARTGDRIVSTVLATMLPQGGDGGSAAAAGGGMDAGE